MLSLVLRHNPSTVGVHVDNHGWANLESIVRGLQERPAWTDLTVEDVEALIEAHTFSRFQVDRGQIRALYGHSMKHVSPGEFAKPPELLFHATRAAHFDSIRREGIAAKSRSHAHLTSSWEYALNVKADHERQGAAAIIFGVKTAIALRCAIPFFQASEVVWTTQYVPPEALVLVTVEASMQYRLVSLSESSLVSGENMASLDNFLRVDDAGD